MSIGFKFKLIRVFPALSSVLLSSAIGSLGVLSRGIGGAVCDAENELPPFAEALGRMSKNFS
jgi:hypothetical protein